MADALSGLAEMQLSAISVHMAFLAGWIATLAGRFRRRGALSP
jgi:hypothetical protein